MKIVTTIFWYNMYRRYLENISITFLINRCFIYNRNKVNIKRFFGFFFYLFLSIKIKLRFYSHIWLFVSLLTSLKIIVELKIFFRKTFLTTHFYYKIYKFCARYQCICRFIYGVLFVLSNVIQLFSIIIVENVVIRKF